VTLLFITALVVATVLVVDDLARRGMR